MGYKLFFLIRLTEYLEMKAVIEHGSCVSEPESCLMVDENSPSLRPSAVRDFKSSKIAFHQNRRLRKPSRLPLL